ncbi:6468_t:CDS:2 [Gigaspora rosea]|nr:6468_t:CDS:2 [Gigaspora rosea]
MDPGVPEIDWTNKLNEYRDVFALSTEKFKKFAITQDDKVCTIELHDWLDHLQVYKHRFAEKLTLTTEQNEVAKEMIIEQECGSQDYGLIEIINKISNLELKKQSRIQKLETNIEEKTEHELLSSSADNNSNPISTNMCTVQTSNTVAKKTTIQNLDCSKDASKLANPEVETQHKNTVHIFTLWNISSEASPGQVYRCLNFFGKANFVRWRTQGTRKAVVFEIKFKDKKRRKKDILLHTRLVLKKAGQVMIQNANPYSKRTEVDEKEKDSSNIDISINSHEQTATDNQEEKLKVHRQENSNNKNQNTVITRSSINKKKEKAKQVNVRTAQEKENNEILAIMLQILTRLDKLEE